MKILVPVKRVVDYNVKIQVRADGSGVEKERVKMSMNPFDEIALEEAIRLHEQGHVEVITALSIGDLAAEDVLRQALAMGAHRAYLITVADQDSLEPLMVAKILHAMVKKLEVDFVLMGKQAIDDDCNQTGQMLAGLMQCAQATFASEIIKTAGGFTVTREVDNGLEKIAVTLPCVLSADLRLNKPRYISLPAIIQAKSKPLKILQLADVMNVVLKPKLQTLRVDAPAVRQPGQLFTDPDLFLQTLRDDGVSL